MGRMINIQMDSDDMIEMLLDRLAVWVTSQYGDEWDCWSEYITDMVEGGVFDGGEFNPMVIIDNLYVNDTSMITRDEWEEYGIEDEDDERILAHVGDCYLVSAY